MSDTADGTFNVNFAGAFTGGQLIVQSILVRLLPRVASIDSLTGAGVPFTFDKLRITPWQTLKCPAEKLGNVKTTGRCVISKLSAPPHVFVSHSLGEKGVVDCSHGVPKPTAVTRAAGDSLQAPDDEGPICAGSVRDPFPSTTVYITATVIDPKAKYFDAKLRKYVVGPLTEKLYYQFAGIRHLKKKG